MSGLYPVTVLVIDSEAPVRKLLRAGLSTASLEMLEASTGEQALDLFSRDHPTLVILDLALPDIEGLELLRKIRSNETVPIVVLSSRADEATIVQALDLGADDFVKKPFGMAELLARLRVALRHRLRVKGEQPVFRCRDLTVDLLHRAVKVEGREISLTPKQYDLLRLLVQHAGKVLNHRFLLRELWGEATDPQYLRVYVRQLRQRIEADPDRPQYLLTEMGIGYRFSAPSR